MAIATVKITQGFIDHSREFSACQFNVAGDAGDDLTNAIADAQAVQTALAVVTLCNFTNLSGSFVLEADTPITPSNAFAQREIALWVQYVDATTGQYGTLQIPGPDLDLLAQANTDEVDIAANVTALALITALEGNLVSQDGNAIEVSRMRIIGRRS